MGKGSGIGLGVLVVTIIASTSHYVYRKYSADFYYRNGTILENDLSFNEERYKLLEDGFMVEKGNFFCYTDEVFESGYYTYKLRILGLTIKYHKVDYANNHAWGFPGLPWKQSSFEGLFDNGRKRFDECSQIVERYRKQHR